ncbi:nesprin-2-like isoform X4 [Chanodichthys erythropterus]|uniref:nesprin-2-like isoform X4 n=1 Tax=Chanodichthys erythropterus TaxID=933992 RepID=UPI00351EC440
MASRGETCAPPEDERVVPLDIDDVHLLLQVEQEQIQKRTFTNWINAQLSKRSPPTTVKDLFLDLRDGTRLLDLLEVMSDQRMKRERGHGVFQQRGNIETALNFLKNKSIKLVNINIPDIIEGKPSIILGLIWTIILHCHIEELASTLSYGSRSSSLDSLSSLDSAPGSPGSSPVPRGASPLHTRFRLSAKKALLLWVRDQCQKVGCLASVRDFKSSWRSGEVFLAILCSLRPDLVDLSQAQTSSHLENLEKAFHLAEKELGIPRLLEPEDIVVSNPDEKSIMTYIAQFLQYSNDLPLADDDFELQTLLFPTCLSPVNLPTYFTPAVLASPLHQASPNQKAREMKCWLQRAYQELLEAWASTGGKGYAERYQAFQNFVGTYYDQRRPVIPVLSAMRRCAKPSEEQMELRKAWDTMEEKLQEYRTELDVALPAPLNTLGRWLQHMETVLSEDSGRTEDHVLAARDARYKQEQLKVLVEDLSQHLNTLHHFRNTDDNGCPQVPIEKLEEIKKRFTSARVTAKYHSIKLQYREQMHNVFDLLGQLKSKLSLWRGPYGSQESVLALLQDWHDTVDKQGLVWMLKEALHKLKDTAVSYTSKAALADDSPVVNRQVKEADSETGVSTEAAEVVKSTMERVLAAWESYKDCLYLLQVWLGQEGQSQAQVKEQKRFSAKLNEWSSRQAQLNEAGNFLIEMSDASTSHSLTEELRRLNMQWADFIKRTKFAVAPQPICAVPGVQAAQGLMQEAGRVLRETVDVSSTPLRLYRKKLQGITKKISQFDLHSLSPSPDCKEETIQKLRQTLLEIFETLKRVDQVCEGLQRPASLLEGRLAELENWSSEAQEVCQLLKEREHRGHWGPHLRTKALISRGLQLEGQVVTEGEDLQALVTSVQKNSSLPYLSTSALQDRLKRTVSHCQEVTEMLSSHGVKREGQPESEQPATKVFVHAHSQPESQTETIQDNLAQTFSKSSKLSLESPVEPQNQEHHSSQLQSQLEATSGVHPQVPPQLHDKSPIDQKKAICQTQQAELKQPLLSSVVRKVQMKPQTEVHLISVDSSQTSSFGPSDFQVVSVKSSQTSGFGPSYPLQVISVDSSQTSGFGTSGTPQVISTDSSQASGFGPLGTLQDISTVSRQTSGFGPSGTLQIISTDSSQTSCFGPSDFQVVSVKSSQTSGFGLSYPLQVISVDSSQTSGFGPSGTLQVISVDSSQTSGFGPTELQVVSINSSQTSGFGPTDLQVISADLGQTSGIEPSDLLQSTSSTMFSPTTLPKSSTVSQPRTTIKQHLCSPPKWQLQTSFASPHQRERVLARSHSFPQSLEPSQTQSPSSPLSCPSTCLDTPFTVTQIRTPIKQHLQQPQTLMTTLGQGQRVLAKSHSFPQPSEAPGVPHVPVQNEVYARAQALARSRLDKAKQHLHDHIQDVITVISARDKSKKQSKKKQAVSRLLRPAVLEIFLEAVKGMGHFCSDAQLKDMDLLSHSVKAQWEECATAADRSVHLKALRRMKESLQPAESVVLSTAHLRVDTKGVESIQHHTDPTSDLAPCQDSRGGAVKDCVLWREAVLLDELSLAHSQAVVQTNIVEIKQIPERTIIHPCSAQEERVTEQEAKSSYCTAKSVLQLQLLNNSQQLGTEFPISPGSSTAISADSLRSQLQHLLALKDHTEGLWCEFELQHSQSSQHMEDGCNMEQERSPLIQQWKGQQMCIQARVKSLETAVKLLESTDIQIRLISDQLKQISQKPLNIRNFAVADARNLHEDLKRLDESIEKELFLLKSEGSVSDSADLSHIELQARLPLQQTLHDRTKCLEQQRQCLSKSESALVALENLLFQLKQVNDDLTAAHSTSDCSYSLVSIQRSLQQAKEESVQLDQILDDAGMGVTLDDKPGSCHEMVSALALHAEEVETKLAIGPRRSDRGGKGREKGEQRVFGRKRMGLQVALREVLTALERHGLKEPTLPALQHRLRFLTDMESKLVALRLEIQDLRDTCAQTSTSDTSLSELQTEWENAHRAVTESLEQCVSLIELLKKFQSCRNRLGSTLQRAEQTIADQAYYMGKDNLQLLISKVTGIKSDLSGLGDGVEEFRTMCRQLQSLMRRIPDCIDAPFESEADTLMDRWLDVTEKTDCHLDNLQAGLSLWEKLLLLAGEVEDWSTQKLITLAQSHPFHTELDVSAMQDELRVQEENIEHFHRRSSEIQELLQSHEFPLELQVIESQLRKKMMEVMELFSETSDVFRQLEAAKSQVASEIADHLSSIQTITNTLSTLTTAESPQVLSIIQGFLEQLETEAEQSDALLQKIDLLASIAGLENLQALAKDGAHLQESICTTRELVIEKREQAMNPNMPENQMVQDRKHIKPQIKKTEYTVLELQSKSKGKTEELSHGRKTFDTLLEVKDIKEQACSWASELHLKGDFQVSEDGNRLVTLEERLTSVQVVEQVERNLLEVEKLSEVLQTSCTPEGQSALSLDLQPLFGKALDQKKILEDERTREGGSDPVQSFIQCNEPQQPGVSTEQQSVQVATGSVVDDLYRKNVKIMPTKEVSGTEDTSCLSFSIQKATADVENIPPRHDADDQQSMSGSEERGETGYVIREDANESSHDSSCGSPKPVFIIVLDSDLTEPNQSPLAQAIPASTTTVSVVHDRTTERSEDGLKLLEAKPNIEPAVDEKHAVICSSDEPVHLCADLSTSEAQFNENNHTDNVEPTHSPSHLDFEPNPEKDSSTQAFVSMVSYPENHHASSGKVKKVFTIILDVDSPTLSSDRCHLLLHDNVSGPEDSSTDEFSQSDVKHQQRSSSGTEKPVGQEAKEGLSEKGNVKSSSSETQPDQKEAIQTKTHEIMEIDIRKGENEKRHEIIKAETSSQMDVQTGKDSDLGSIVHQKEVTMLESHNEGEKNTFAEPSNEANILQKPSNVAKGRKKNKKSAGVKQGGNINTRMLKTSRSEQKNTTDSENLQTSEVRLLDITHTSITVSSDCSQPNSAKQLSTEDKLTKVMDIVQEETLNRLHTETKDEKFEIVSLAGETKDRVVLTAMETVQSANTEDSETVLTDASPVMKAECISQISAAVPSKSQLRHAEAQRMDDSDGSFPLQYEEMQGANSDPSTRNKSSENRGSVAAGKDEMSHSENPTGTHVWATLVNTITNIQAPLVTSQSSEETRPWKDSLFRNSILSESESSLAWTALQVFRCRYRPAQLNIAHMTLQLEEAEICRQCVLDQVARLPRNNSGAGCFTEPEQGIEGRWNAVLLDTSAMAEFKKAQLQQVTQYHKQKRALKDTLNNLEVELSTLTVDCIESSTLQAEKLSEFLKSMQKKSGILEELLQSCSQISAHLGEAEGPVACIEPVRTLQKRWQTLEWAASRSLWHANICTAEVSGLLQEARDLQRELDLLEKSVSTPHTSQSQIDWQSALHETVRTADLAVLNERYLYLLEVSQALSSSPLGKKELRDVEDALQGLNSQLAMTQEKLSSQTLNGADYSPIIRIVRDYVTWAKQMESKVSRRRRLSLYPEEASHEVNHLKKLQSETSLKKFQLASVLKELREEVTGLEEKDSKDMLPTLDSVEDLYVKISEKNKCAVVEINRMFHIRERLWKQITDSSSWLTSILEKESGKSVASELKITIPELRVQLQVCTEALKDAERQAKNLEILLDETKTMNNFLTVPESFQLINRLTSLQEEVSRVVNRKWASCWVLEELLHSQESSAEEQNFIQKSLRQLSADVMRQKYPITRDSLSALESVKHMLIELLCKVQEIPHFPEPRRKEMLHAVLDLQRRIHLLEQQAKEHEEYLTLRQHMENSKEAVKKNLSHIVDSCAGTDIKLGVCQAVLVELPLVRMTCQEAADHLEAISKDLYPSQLTAERQKIRLVTEQLAAWELSVKNEAKKLECSLAEKLVSPTDLSPLMKLFNSVRQQLKETICLEPDNKAIDAELRKHWTLVQNLESVLRMLDVCRKGEVAESYQKTVDLGQRTLNDCSVHMDKLLKAREALKRYCWAVQGAESFFHHIESNLMISFTGFQGYKEEHHYIQQIFSTLVEGFQARLSEVGVCVPQQKCLSIPLTEQLHIEVLSHLLVQDAKLEAQAQLRLEALQRCMRNQIVHMSHHEEMSQLLKNVDSQILKCSSKKPTDSEACQEQQLKVLQTELKNLANRLEELRESCTGRRCSAPVDLMLGHLWRSWAVLQCRVESLKASTSHKEAEWRDVVIRLNKSKEGLSRLQNDLPDSSVMMGSLLDLQGVLSLTERLQDRIEQEHHTLASLQHHVARLLRVSNLQQLKVSPQICQDLQSLQGQCRSLRDQSNNIRREVLSEIQELGHVQEEMSAIQQNVLSLLTVLQSESAAEQLQEVKVDLVSLKAQLQDVMDRVQKKWSCVPSEIQILQNDLNISLQEAKDKLGMVMERSGPLHKMGEQVGEVTVGLNCVQALLKQTSPNFSEAEHTQKRIWDELDQWHTRIAELEAEVQDLAEQQPERAHVLMDQLTEPLQLYQITAKQAEQRTALISKIPACLQDCEGFLSSSESWLKEAQSWLDAPRTYTTAKCIHCHANSLKMMLDESEGYKAALEAFLPALQEITLVCDTTSQQQQLHLGVQKITLIQQSVLDPLSHLQHLAAEMDAIEMEVKTMEKNISKIRTILSTTDTENISPEEHLEDIQVILDNVQSMKRTIDEIESCRPGLGLPAEAEQTLTAFHRAQVLLQPIQELQQLSVERSAKLRASIGQPSEMILPSDQTTEFTMPHFYSGDVMQVSMEGRYTEEEDEDSQSSSSGTLTCSVPEDPDETNLEEENIKTDAASTVTECVVKESSPEEETDFAAVKHALQETDPGRCLLEPPGFLEMPDIDSRPVTEETSCLPALTTQHFEEFTNDSCMKPDSATRTEEMQNECLETKVTEAVSAKPGTDTEITMLKASQSIKQYDSVDLNKVSINTEIILSDQVKMSVHKEGLTPKPPDTEAVYVTDGDQTQAETKPIGATAPLVLSFQHKESVPQEDTMLEIQRDLIDAIVRQSSSQSQEHSFQHTATLSDLSQSEEGGEYQECLVQLLTSMKETSEKMGSCQDISSSESLQGSTWTLPLDRLRSARQNNVELQRCSEAHLKGLRGLLELGSERLLRSQDAQPHICSQLHSQLRGHKKYFEDLGQNLVMVKLLYHKLPEGALPGQAEVERLISDLQDQAQSHGIQMQHSLHEWSWYEEVTERLCKQFDEMETDVSSLDLEPEGDLQGQLESYERLHKVLEDTRSEIWEIQDRLMALQKKGCCFEWPGQTFPKSRLLTRWKELHNQLQQKIQSTQKIRMNYERFQHDSTELEEWMSCAHERVQKWKSFSDSAQLDSRVVFTQLMEFFSDLVVRSTQKASAESAGMQILQLTESESPGLRRRLAQLEKEWTNLTSMLPTLHQTQQQLLTSQSHSQVLADLTSWLERVERRLEDESSGVQCALGSSELSRHLQALKNVKAEITSHQSCIDFLNYKSVEGAGLVNEPTNRSERILFAEQLGALNLSWLVLQAKIDSEIHNVEDQWQACTDREKRLHCMQSWISHRMEWVRNSWRPESCSQIEQTLQECEDTEERLQVKSSELKGLRALHLFGLQDGEHPGDQAFSKQVHSAIQDCQALSQQINALRLDLQPIKDKWAHFDSNMSAAKLQTTSVAYRLELCRVPVFSSEQSRTHVEHLQELERELDQSKTWTQLTQVFSDLRDKLKPCTSKLLSDHLEKERSRHLEVTEDLHADLLKAQKALRFWQEYERLTGECFVLLNQHWERLGELMSSSDREENTVELLNSRMQSISTLEKDMSALQSSVGKVLEASKLLIGQIKPQSASLIKSETRLLSRDHVHLGKALSEIAAQVQEELEEHCHFSTELKSMEQQLKNFESILSSSTTSMERLKMVMLDLSGLNPNLAALNQKKLFLSSTEEERLQTLNTEWVQVFSQATDRHRKMYGDLLRAQNFQQKCQCWMELLDQIEAGLSNQMSGNYATVREQLAVHQRLKVEVLISQQLQDAMIIEALRFLESGQNEDRSRLILRLTQLKAQWQGTQQRVQQHGKRLEGLMGHWQLYEAGSRKLSRLLRHIEELLPPAGLALCSLQQLHCSIKDFEWTQKQLQLHEELYSQTVEAGRQIIPLTDAHTQTCLQSELDAFMETWERSCGLVEKRKALADTITHNWKLCEIGLADCALKLEEIKARLKIPLPEKIDDLKTHEQLTKEDEGLLQIWAGGLKELSTMKADVSQYVLPTDTALLQGQVEELHSQWEELCLKVSLRKQEIADRLNAWIIFNDKNKELCDWLTQMEKKVAHRGENLSIEEMVEKLKKDCMEEINLFSENKSHLKQLGEQLLLASDKAKEAEIHGALRDVNDRWQHLFDHIEARVKKLTETLVTVQQLDKNMNNLRSWLTRIEAELAKPIHYSICHRDEIQKRLAEQQDLQRDIEQHTERVASVLTLCDVLLRDEDACSSDGENDSIQHTTQRLDQRWRNICSMSLERRLRIEETWRLWCKFQEDYSSFEDWLNVAECSAAEPNSSDVLYTDAKEELQKYEGFQRQVHESLTQLEIINNQYRRLARENRTDAASSLRAMVHHGNQRWDALQRRVAAILRRLRHFTSQREEFEGTRESLLVWLTEIDLQLTNMEHFSEIHLQDKMKQLKSFKKEITLNTNKIDALIVFGEGLIQRSLPLDAVVIEDELEELHTYCQEVFGRVARFHQRLTSLRLEQPDIFDGERSRETQSTPASSQPSMCLLSPPQERSGRETPISVDSIPLEWDHTGDVGGSSSHDEEEDAAFFSALSDLEVTEIPEFSSEMTKKSFGEPLGQNWHFQNTPERKSFQLDDSSPTHASTPFKQGYVQLMSECSGSIKSVKRVSMILDEEQQEEQGLTGLSTADKQSGVIERWELLQAQAVSKEQCCTKDAQQLTSDLNDITSWLDRVTPELDRLQKPETSASVKVLEERVKQLKEMQKTFACYKTMMLSLNLGGRELHQGATGHELQEGLRSMNRRWTEACAGLEGWEGSLRNTLERCQEFHEMVHSLLLWLAHAESRRYTVNMDDPSVQPSILQEHRNTLKDLAEELQGRQKQVSSLQEIVSELLPEAAGEDSAEAREKLHVIGSKLRLLSRQVEQDLQMIQERLESTTDAAGDRKSSECSRSKRDPSPQRSFFYRVLRAAFPLHLLFLLLLVVACLVPLSEDDYSCTLSNNFARSFHPMLRYTNGPPPT